MRSNATGILHATLVLLVLAYAPPAAGQSKAGDAFIPQAPLVDQAGRREWAWEGRDSLTIEGAGAVRYESDGDPRIVITGDPEAVANIEVAGSVIRERKELPWRLTSRKLNILVQGIILNHITCVGSATIDLGSLQKDRLALVIDGSGAISARGRSQRLEVTINGSGRANLGNFSAVNAVIVVNGSGSAIAGNADGAANIEVNGSGTAAIDAVTGGARIKVSGSGTASLDSAQSVDADLSGPGYIRLHSLPGRASYHVSGSGAVLLVAPNGKVTELARERSGNVRDQRDMPRPPR